MLHIAPSGTPSSGRARVLEGPLRELARIVERACDGPPSRMAGRIAPALSAAAAEPGLLAAGQCQARTDTYARHVLYGDPAGRFTVLALVWGTSQFSPPHAHHAWCAYAVRAGVLDETLFAYDAAAGMARPVRTATRTAGYACFAHGGLDQIHRLGNAGVAPAISIHVYGVGRERIATDVNRLVQVGPAEG
ncbi:MAG TPA: cysteine dioxygenase family protein [Xanthobacteraceae bacterium]|jgi:predicted metal-dependent enzyme (double-stranded beta helix superfamily)